MIQFIQIDAHNSGSPIFLPNKGQFPNNVHAQAKFNAQIVWFTHDGVWFQFFDEEELEKLHDKSIEDLKLNTHVIKMQFENGYLGSPKFEGNISEEYYNYFIGKEAKNWVSGLHKYSRISYKNVYQGIDLEFIADPRGLKYNWIVHKGADHNQIKVKYDGAEPNFESSNEIRLVNEKNTTILTESIPIVYELNNSNNQRSGHYSIESSSVSVLIDEFNVLDKSKSWVIDPLLVFSTYSGSLADNFGCTGTYDDLGNAYSGGTVFNFGLPTTTGAFQGVFAGGKNENLGYGGSRDAAILKFNTIGNSLLYCTYLGGNNNEQPHSMVVDSQFNLFIMGTTRSQDFPITKDAFDESHNGDYDFFIARLNATGTQLLGSTYFGAVGLDGVGADRSNRNVNDFPLIYNYADEFRGEIISDQNNIYVGGVTYSADFPHTVSSAYPTVFSSSNGVIFSLDKSLSTLNWSHVIGTKQDDFDAIYGIALNDSGQIFGAGGTYSSVYLTEFQKQYSNKWFGQGNNGLNGSSADGILLRLDSKTGEFQYGRYFGTGEYDQAYFVQTDNSGRPYIYGQTEGNFASINARYHDDVNNGQFIARFSQDLSNLELQATFGANGNKPNLSPSAFLIDRCERIFISGWGGNTNTALYDLNTGNDKQVRNRGNTRNLPLTSDAIQRQTDGSDFYVAVFAKDMYELAFATFFGGITRLNAEAEEHVDGGTSRFDKKGIIYQSLCGGCRQNGVYPTTPGAWSRNMPSPNCNNAMFKIDFENLNRKPKMNPDFVEVIANDKIDLKLIATDPDLFDTVRIQAKFRNLPSSLGIDTPQIIIQQGIGQAEVRVFWETNCNSVLSDTLIVDVMVFDCGCPTADTSYTTIKILVTPPPLVPPPDAICVLFERFQNRMRIEWPSQPINSQYFKYFILIKTKPDGSQLVLDTLRTNAGGFFIDNDVIDPHINNYCYEIIAVNICDQIVQAPYKWCSVSSLNSPLTPVHLISASVFEDKRIDVKWQRSMEPDFKDYEVYKYKKGVPSKPGMPYLVTTDTTLSDSSFDVDSESYCYEIVVTDKCGHISNASNPGCNVVLKGTSKYWPDPYFDLEWDDYRGWENGVSNWVIERKHGGNTQFKFLNSNGTDRKYRDNQLDYDWGGYTFRVIGQELVANGQVDYSATSESNWIYLIQPPEVWVPNAFTVNGDNTNEVWGTYPLFVKNYSMKVYDRWGKKIWESSAKKKQWDGTYNGKQVQDGVYAWLLTFDGWNEENYQKTGTVLVIH